MTADDQADPVLAFAGVLYVNGQAAEQMVDTAERLGSILGLSACVIPRWGELQFVAENENGPLTVQALADPTGVQMDRVASAMRVVGDIASGRITPSTAQKTIDEISRLPPAPTWLFALASAVGAVSLAVIFGVEHATAALLIFVSAGTGAFLRRALGRVSTNLFLQPFCAAALASLIGAIAVRWNLSSSLRLVAVCPCMILVPGPHFLNGVLDLINARIALGAARLVYAGLIVVAIGIGLLIGLALLGASLPGESSGRAVPLWQDVLAAGSLSLHTASFSLYLCVCCRGSSRSECSPTHCDG